MPSMGNLLREHFNIAEISIVNVPVLYDGVEITPLQLESSSAAHGYSASHQWQYSLSSLVPSATLPLIV